MNRTWKRHRATQYHEDHERPMDVVWLCQPCHAARHREIRGAAKK